MPRKSKKAQEIHTHIAVVVHDYAIRSEAGLNINLVVDRPIFYDDEDLAYEFVTTLDVSGKCIYPPDREGDCYEITIKGGERHAGIHSQTLKDFQKRDEHGVPLYRTYRGERIPVFDCPPGIAILEKRRGERIWVSWMWVKQELVRDMLTVLAHVKPVYLHIHEFKKDRQRWVRSISLQTTNPEDE